VVVGLVALIVFPLSDPARFHALGQGVAGDREMAYPILMKLILPSGLLGLIFVSLMAAFMSTVDTHINWGASYLANDIYRRFIRKNASQRELVAISRASVILISILAILIASQIRSIEKAWKFFVAIGAGLGLPQILRWVWWRANAWTEIAGMLSALAGSAVLYLLFPGTRAEYLLFWIVLLSASAALAATFLTPPVSEATLRRFIAKTSPFGFWKGLTSEQAERKNLASKMYMWILGVVATFSGMFGIGYLVRLNWPTGLALLLIGGISFRWLIKIMAESDAYN